MAITADWQMELRSVLIGAGTDYTVMRDPGPAGLLGTPSVRSGDVDLMGDGAGGGVDRYASRLITVPVDVFGGSPETTNARVQTLLAAWRRSSVDTPLDVRVPGQPETVLRYFGRARGGSESMWSLLAGHQGVLLAFAALDPFAYGAEVASATDSATPLTIAAATLGHPGTVTDRAVLTVVAAGGTPSITNTTTGGTIAFATAATGTYVIDLREQVATKAGVNVDHELAASSDWFALAGGVDNVLTFAGCTSIQLTHRPAFEVI
jgi:hypothetical protein